ncbi:MAG: FMN-binding protein [Clostridia bacterium]|nr:FMN-binding protein [Clostridia bacterium]MBP5174004.1 FMN-binding protein [Clostridia bacterium]
MKGYIKPVLSLTIICLVTGLILSAVNLLTEARIADNLSDAEKRAVAEVFGDSLGSYLPVEEVPDSVNKVYRVTDPSGELAGYCVSVSPNGFGGNIDMVVGISPEGTLIGVAITALSETPGLGSRVADPEYLAGYAGLSGIPALGRDIDAISGATISSRSVLRGVTDAIEAVRSMELSKDGGLS